MVKPFKTDEEKGVLIQIEEGMSDFKISAEYRPYCVWLHANGLKTPMPIGNIIYPYRHDQIRIGEIKEDADGRWLTILVI